MIGAAPSEGGKSWVQVIRVRCLIVSGNGCKGNLDAIGKREKEKRVDFQHENLCSGGTEGTTLRCDIEAGNFSCRRSH